MSMDMGKKQGTPSKNPNASKKVPPATVVSQAERSDSASHEQWRAARTGAGRPGAPEPAAPGVPVGPAPPAAQDAATRDEVLNGKRPDADAALVRDVIESWRNARKPDPQVRELTPGSKARVQR